MKRKLKAFEWFPIPALDHSVPVLCPPCNIVLSHKFWRAKIRPSYVANFRFLKLHIKTQNKAVYFTKIPLQSEKEIRVNDVICLSQAELLLYWKKTLKKRFGKRYMTQCSYVLLILYLFDSTDVYLKRITVK